MTELLRYRFSSTKRTSKYFLPSGFMVIFILDLHLNITYIRARVYILCFPFKYTIDFCALLYFLYVLYTYVIYNMQLVRIMCIRKGTHTCMYMHFIEFCVYVHIYKNLTVVSCYYAITDFLRDHRRGSEFFKETPVKKKWLNL